MSTSFNLLDEPWVLVRQADGHVESVGLLEVFGRSSELRGLAGEVPTQEIAILRLLIAVLYRALPATGTDAHRRKEWALWWDQGQLPLEPIRVYLENHRDRFDLLHPAAPFMQVADLHTSKPSGLRKLIADQPDGEQFFTTRAGRGAQNLSLAEATRWLIHCQQFDPSGIKTGAVGDKRVKGGKGYPIGTGWAGNLGLVTVEGSTLGQTLLLSWDRGRASAGEDRPVWERDPLTAGCEPGHASPTGPADLLTWPSRRVRLVVRGDVVTDVLLCNGDQLHPRNRMAEEPHTAWRYSANQVKMAQKEGRGSGTVYMPRIHDAERVIWRGLPGLLAQVTGGGAARSDPEPLQPGVLDWVASLRNGKQLSGTTPITVRTTGIVYGPQSSTVAVIMDDALRLRTAVVTDHELRTLAVRAVECCELAVAALRHLASNLAGAGGLNTDGHPQRTAEMGYMALDPGYRRWIAHMHPESEQVERMTVWQHFVRTEICRIAEDLVRSAGQPAWVGRTVSSSRGDRIIDSGKASLWFYSELAKALPLTRHTPVGDLAPVTKEIV